MANMRIRLKRFNTYLLSGIFVVTVLTACQSLGGKKEASTLRLHVEVTPDGTENNGPVPIGRTEPAVFVNVEKQPFLNEGAIEKASVVDQIGGFAISIQFDQKGTWMLEQYSTAHKGRRVAILSQFGKVRWLGAPVMTKRIVDGKLVFTPDAT